LLSRRGVQLGACLRIIAKAKPPTATVPMSQPGRLESPKTDESADGDQPERLPSLCQERQPQPADGEVEDLEGDKAQNDPASDLNHHCSGLPKARAMG
jgi:hypothetical protein